MGNKTHLPDECTVAQAAAHHGCTTAAIQQHCKNGTLPARRFGKVWIITRADVLAFRLGKAGRPKKPLVRA